MLMGGNTGLTVSIESILRVLLFTCKIRISTSFADNLSEPDVQ